MIRPFEGFDWGALALLSKAPLWNDDDYRAVADRLREGLLVQAVSLGAAVAPALAERLGVAVGVDPEIGASVSALDADPGDDGQGRYLDYTLVTFTVADSAAWLRIRIGHDTVGFACGIDLDEGRLEAWGADVDRQCALTAALAHHPTLSVIGFAPEAAPPPPPPRRPTPFPQPPPPPSPALVGPVGPGDVRIGWHDPMPPTSTLPRFVPFCVDRLAEFGVALAAWADLRAKDRER
jgi:hypothetical protein